MPTLRKVYGDQTPKLLEHLDDLLPGLGMRIAEDAYGTVMARPGLTLAERELVNVIVLFIEGYHRQLYSHLRGSLRSGVSPAVLKSVLRSAGKIAKLDVRRPLATVDDIVRSRSARSL
jgi:4-carboxymuconolactone decarboxylase